VDNQPDQAPVATFTPDRRYTALALLGVLIAVVLLVLTDDLAGRLLAGVAALVLAIYAVSDLVFSPRLVASGEGLVVRSPLTRARLPWSAIEDVRADRRARFGLRSTTLEIDAGPVLAVLSRRALGSDPQDAAELINAFRPR
jgi:hypothetical protein